ncbi:YbgA family protein [Marinicella sp. W31]|uniref:YbgA family protein n=1 Tax=Marinicella sp. W31 TaxID=3023713 RepID=UPI003758156A
MSQKIKVAISACLLGQKVRYNGQHKQSAFCVRVLSEWFDFLPICPEVEIGMGIPREPIHLVQTEQGIRAQNISDHSEDYTDALAALAEQKKSQLQDVCGYIFMQKSPSCGAFRVKIYHPNGNPIQGSSAGIYADRVISNHPQLPVEEAGRLNDTHLRENFITRVYANHEWQQTVMQNPTPQALVDFHMRHKYLLFAHAVEKFRELGRLVAAAGQEDLEVLLDQYHTLFMQCLSKPASLKNHINVMYHVLGYMKRELQPDAKKEIIDVIERYRQKAVNLIVPLTLLKHYVNVYQIDYMQQQKYLSPYPYELGLRNNI